MNNIHGVSMQGFLVILAIQQLRSLAKQPTITNITRALRSAGYEVEVSTITALLRKMEKASFLSHTHAGGGPGRARNVYIAEPAAAEAVRKLKAVFENLKPAPMV